MINIGKYEAGTYTANVTFYGSTNYNDKSIPVEFTVSRVTPVINVTIGDATYPGDAIAYVNVSDYANGTVNITVDGKVFNATVSNGVATVVLSGLSGGVKVDLINFTATDNYHLNLTTTVKSVVIQKDSTITLEQSGRDVIANVISGATGNVTFYINGVEYANIAIDNNGQAVLQNVLLIGNNTVVAVYDGDVNYTSSRNYTNFTVARTPALVNVTATYATYGGDSVITVKVPAAQTGYVRIVVDGTDINATVEIIDGEAKLNVSGLNVARYLVNVTYLGDKHYDSEDNYTYFNITKADLTASGIGLNVTVKEDVGIVITVPGDFNGNVKVNVSGIKYDDEVIPLINIGKFDAGSYTANVTFYGDNNYNDKSISVRFDVARVTPTINVTIDDVTYPSNARAVIEIGNNANGTVNITVDGKVFNTTVRNGLATLDLTGLSAGKKEANVEFFTDDDYNENATAIVKFFINKNSSDIIIEGLEDSYKVGQTINIDITPINSTGNVNVYIDGEHYTNVVYDQGKYTIHPVLGEGTHFISVVLDSDENFTGSSRNASFVIVKNNIEISVGNIAGSIVVGSPVNITANLNTTVTGDVIFTINGANYTVHVSNNNTAVFEYTPEDNSTIDVVATFTGNDMYCGNVSDARQFNVDRISTGITVSVDSSITIGENAVVTISMNQTINGTVKLRIGGKEYDVAVVNGVGIYNVSGLANNTYDVNVTFAGDTKYGPANNNTTLQVIKIDSYIINVTVTDIDFGENETIVVVLPPDIDPSKLTVMVDGNVKAPVSVINGVATIVVSGLPIGEHEVNVTYAGDDKYVSKNNNSNNFTVGPSHTFSITLTIENNTYGEDTIIKALVANDVTNNVTITVDGKDYSVKPDASGLAVVTLNNLSGGLHEVTATYPGDDKYSSTSKSATFTIARAKSNITVDFITPQLAGDDVLINVTMGQRINGTVTLSVGKQNYTVTVVNGVGSYLVPGLTNGTYDVKAAFNGNENYTGNSSAVESLAVNKVPTSISITVTDSINVGEIAVVNVTINQKLNGSAIVSVGGQNYTVAIVDGNGTLTLTDLANGVYTINATFKGDDKYINSTSNTLALNVNRVATDINVTVQTPVNYGNDAVITVELNATINTTAKLTVDGKTYDVALIGGKGVFNVSGLSSGSHDVDVVFAGDNRYSRSANSTVFTMGNATLDAEVIALNVTAVENTKFVLNVTDDFKGNVSIKVNGELVYNGTVKTLIEAAKLLAGNKNATLVFYGDNNYDELVIENVLFTVSDVVSNINVTIDDVTYPSVAVAFINIHNNANGTVNVTVDGKVFNGTVVNGVASVNLSGLSAGSKVASVQFFNIDGTTDNATAKFTILKADSAIVIDVDNVYIYNETIIINLTSIGSQAAVNVTINGKVYPVSNKQIIIENITAGDYTIIADLSADENYTGAYNSTTFKVKKAQTSVSIDVESVYNVGDDIVITINAVNSTDLTVTINGESYTVTGNNITIAGGLDAGDYIVNAILAGNDNYTGSNDTKSFKVVKVQSELTVNVTDITVDQTETIKVNVTAGATGQVIITVDGKPYYTVIDGEFATLKLDNLTYGTHTVQVKYLGDENYNESVGQATFTVDRLASSISVDVENITLGDVAAVKITVTANATGNVTIEIGTEYNQTVGVVDGEFTVIVPGLTIGNKTVKVTYNGDGRFLPSNATAEFNVGKSTSIMNVVVGNVTYGEKVPITVFVNGTGNVTIEIEGLAPITVNIIDGKAEDLIEGLNAGNYTARITYSGNDGINSTTVETGFEVAKANPTININVTDIVYGDVEHIIITSDAPGNVTVKINGQEIVVELTLENGYQAVLMASRWNTPYDGCATVDISNLKAGKYDVEVIYNGNENYNVFTATADFDVVKADTNITVEKQDSMDVGESQVINITINNTNASGKVIINIGGENYTADLTGGFANYTIEKLAGGNYTVTVIYEGDDNLTGSWTQFNIEVIKLDADVNLTVSNSTVGGKQTITVEVPSDATGQVLIDIANNHYYANVTDGKAILELDNLLAGEYDIVVTYLGDENYTSKSVSDKLKIVKNNSTVNIIAQNINAGDNEVIKFTVPEDATGNITVVVAGETYSVPVSGGNAILIIPDLPANNYTVIATYNGDDKYDSNTNSTRFEVAKAIVLPDDIKVVDQGNGTVVVVVPSDLTGEISVKVGNDTYNATIENGTATITLDNITPGVHEVEVIYSGDENHSNATITTVINTNKYEAPISVDVENISVGETAVITVNVPNNATGMVTIEIDGKSYELNITGGKAVFEIENLTGGNKTIAVEYSGDDNYLANRTTAAITVSKAAIQINMDINVEGDKLILNVTVPEDATRPVLVDVDGEGYYVNITDGKGQFAIEGISAGEHTVVVRYLGDDKYNASEVNGSFNISEVPSSVSVKVDNITYGEDAVVEVSVPKDATGNVTVTVDGESYVANVTDGKAIVVIDGLKAGNHTLDVIYSGDDKYNSSTASAEVEIAPAEVNPDDIKVVDYGNGTAVIIVPSDMTGEISVKVGNDTYNATIENGTATITLDNITPGVHEVEVIYSGDENHSNATITTVINTNKYEAPISVDVENISVGETAVITVNVPNNATGMVTIEIDGKSYELNITGGKAVFEIENLTNGTKTIAVEYSGDENYLANHTTATITVSKVTPDVEMNISVNGSDLVIDVVAPVDATRPVLIDIDDVGYYVNLTDGKGQLVISDVSGGEHYVCAKYLGDDKYSSSQVNQSVNITDVPSDISIKIDNITQGEDLVVEVTLPKDATGNVTVTIGDEQYTVNVTDGKAVVVVEGLEEGNYTVNVTYSGDIKYAPSSNSTNITIFENPLPTSIVDIVVNKDYVVTARLVDCNGVAVANATIKYSVDGVENTTVTAADGSFTIAGQSKCVIEIGYEGNSSLLPTETSIKLNFKIRLSTYIVGNNFTQYAIDYYAGERGGYFNVQLFDENGKYLANKPVKIGFNGKVYNCTTDAKGWAKLQINLRNAGSYTFAVGFLGDDDYTGSMELYVIKVNKKPTAISASAASFTASAATKKYTVTLSTSKCSSIDGKTYLDSGKVIKLEIGGKTFTAKTDSKGKATFDISLTKKGTYTATVKFAGDRSYEASSKSVKITLK